jgi:TatD DNase family protein
MLVDSHCHLDYFGADADAIVARAGAAGVGVMVTIGTKLSEFPQVLAIAERHENVYCSVGVHPHEAASEPDISVERLVELARHPKVVGIGETGLDYYYDHSPRERQREVFQMHIDAARAVSLPLIIHNRNSDSDLIEILYKNSISHNVFGVVHCFSSTRQLAEKAMKIGFHISLSGIVTFKNAGELREIAADLPDDRLLVETDAPYLAPMPHRGKKNEPAFVAHTARLIAELRGVSEVELAKTTTDNFFRLFSKAKRPAPAQP